MGRRTVPRAGDDLCRRRGERCRGQRARGGPALRSPARPALLRRRLQLRPGRVRRQGELPCCPGGRRQAALPHRASAAAAQAPRGGEGARPGEVKGRPLLGAGRAPGCRTGPGPWRGGWRAGSAPEEACGAAGGAGYPAGVRGPCGPAGKTEEGHRRSGGAAAELEVCSGPLCWSWLGKVRRDK